MSEDEEKELNDMMLRFLQATERLLEVSKKEGQEMDDDTAAFIVSMSIVRELTRRLSAVESKLAEVSNART